MLSAFLYFLSIGVKDTSSFGDPMSGFCVDIDPKGTGIFENEVFLID